MRVVIVGAGAAGSLVLLHLARQLAEQDEHVDLDVVLLDPNEPVRGAAFGTADRRHLLNVPASGMSADPDDRFDFVRWCEAEGLLRDGASPYWFAPRLEWARYLRARLGEAQARCGDRIRVEHRRALATDVRCRDAGGVRIATDDAESILADHLVLATGLPGVGDDWAPDDLDGQAAYVADPWAPQALEPVLDDDGDVVVVGTGLTMIDVAVSMLGTSPSRRVVAISRRGRLPRRHAASYLGEEVPDVATWGDNLAQMREAAGAYLAEVERHRGDWRPGVDGIRYRVAELWSRLGDSDRAAFVRDLAGEWGVHRHRVPPVTAAVIDDACRAGRLDVRSGKIVGVEAVPGGVEIRTADGASIRSAWVINCTGPRTDLRQLGNPVLDSLLGLAGSSAIGATDPLGLGLVTDGGRVVDAHGWHEPIWAVGALRRGELWESTAIPEIRAQARDVAAALVG